MKPRKRKRSKPIQIDLIGARRMMAELFKISLDEWHILQRMGLIVHGEINKASPHYHGERQFQVENVHRFFSSGLEIAIQFTGLDLSADVIRQKIGMKLDRPEPSKPAADATILIGR
jgi:hypothetical protein